MKNFVNFFVLMVGMYTEEELRKINIENLFKKYTNIDPNKLSWGWTM